MCLPLDGDHAGTYLVFKELRKLYVGGLFWEICEVDGSCSILSSDENSVVVVVCSRQALSRCVGQIEDFAEILHSRV